MLGLLQKVGSAGFTLLRRALATAFDAPVNPLRHLGALTIFFFWIVLVSGIWLFAFFHTSVAGAYASIEYLTEDQWYLGGVMRSLHRYASDAAIITLLLHILKEFSLDRYRSARWFSWFTGVPLLWLVFPLGITGYWLVWDDLAHYVALTSAELLDAIPIFTDSMARNFLSDEVISDRFFTLMAFLHLIGLPIFLVFGIWIHVFRISAPEINPPRTLMAGFLLAMLVVSLVFPAVSQAPVDLSRVPDSVGLDWYYLLVYPLVEYWSPGWLWVLLVGISLLLSVAPWLPPGRTRSVAVVDLGNCNGCERCVDDCPFDAVDMAPRSDGTSYEREAVVDPDKCISCGICVGACPTASPFRVHSELVPGIDLPDQPAAGLRDAIHEAAGGMSGAGRILVVGCEGSAVLSGLSDGNTSVLHVTCIAQLPPPYIDYILSRDLADGVLLAGCAGGDCQYRLGTRWTEERLDRHRDPHLRKRVDTDRIAMSWRPPWSEHATSAELVSAFRTTLTGTVTAPPAERARPYRPSRVLALGITYGLFALVVGWLSIRPRLQLLSADQAMISLTFSHAGQRLGECHALSAEELAALPPNMRAPQECPRERRPVAVEFRLDEELLYAVTQPPSGIWSDGESTFYQRLPVASGTHTLAIGMRDSGRDHGFDFEFEREVDLAANQHLLVEFDAERGTFVFR
jgi:quinol-cytochrome oxidoreductase complex cytochrome b subunit/coenzyme F420-reducing hydrogenase delta subunit/ferredoxin